MSTVSEFNSAVNAEIDHEHEVQVSLLQALCQAVREQRDAASVAQMLDQLTAYCEAHFVSEELMMRQKSFDDYEDHVDDHCHMLDLLRVVATDHATGRMSALTDNAEAVLAFLGKHIATRDKRFADFLRSGQ
jgi:hemerythrin-like metal-binding protein